jgi:hypothetical protein
MNNFVAQRLDAANAFRSTDLFGSFASGLVGGRERAWIEHSPAGGSGKFQPFLVSNGLVCRHAVVLGERDEPQPGPA